MNAYVFTCPHCCTIVDYSCMCSVDRSIADFVGHDTVDDAKAHIDANRTLDGTARPCGEWSGTPAYLRLLGFPRSRRSIYAHAMIGGGWDGFEFDDDHPIAGPTPLPSDSAVWTAFVIAVIAILISAAGVVYYTSRVAG